MMVISLPYFITFLAILFSIAKVVFKKLRKSGGPKLPPGPWKLPIIGSIHHLAAGGPLVHLTMTELAKKYGPLMHLQLGQVSMVVASTARAAKEVLKTHDLSLAFRPNLPALEIITYGNLDIGFSPYGEYWKQMRRICMVELLGPKSVRGFLPIREEGVSEMIKTIESAPPGAVMDVSELVVAFTNGVICRAAFGKQVRGESAIVNFMNEARWVTGGFRVADLFPSLKFLQNVGGAKAKVMKVHRELDEILDMIIEEHRTKMKVNKNGGGGDSTAEDVVDVLLRLQESGGLQVPNPTDTIKAFIVDMFFAGTDTTAGIIEWAMAEMMKQPKVMQKAQAELRNAFSSSHDINETGFKELNYLKMVIKETLRLHPMLALLVPRECRYDVSVDGFDIPAGTRVIVNAWSVNRDPDYWRNPKSFEPDRFIDKDIDHIVGDDFEFVSFGGGRRICPGVGFGMANTQICLAHLLYRFDWSLPQGLTPESLDMTEDFGLSVKKKTRLQLIATPYNKSTEEL